MKLRAFGLVAGLCLGGLAFATLRVDRGPDTDRPEVLTDGTPPVSTTQAHDDGVYSSWSSQRSRLLLDEDGVVVRVVHFEVSFCDSKEVPLGELSLLQEVVAASNSAIKAQLHGIQPEDAGAPHDYDVSAQPIRGLSWANVEDNSELDVSIVKVK